MTIGPLPASRVPVSRLPPGPADRGAIARRRVLVGFGKVLLPLVAVALLATLALWPEFNRDIENGRLSFRRMSVTAESGELSEPHYRGVDSSGQPYTISAATARQSGQNRTDMVQLKADMTQESGVWLMLEAQRGVYLPREAQLDLEGEVTLYREDGLTMRTDAATMNLRDGAASGTARVHLEGPFGTLDSQGFDMLDKGSVLHFTGPGRLVMNGGGK